MLQGIVPKGYGDWEIEITALPCDAPFSREDLEKKCNDGNGADRDEFLDCADFATLYVDLMHCDYDGDEEIAEKIGPERVKIVQEWDGNSVTVSWESQNHFFVMEYSTS